MRGVVLRGNQEPDAGFRDPTPESDVGAVFSDRWSIEDAEEAYRGYDQQTRGSAVFQF